MDKWLAVALGGAAGSLLRYAVCLGCQRWLGDRFAWGVLLVNAVGCLAIGALMHAALREQLPWSAAVQAGLVVGLLGGLTTFSSFGYDTFVYLEAGAWRTAVANVTANIVVGLAMVMLGHWLVGRWPGV